MQFCHHNGLHGLSLLDVFSIHLLKILKFDLIFYQVDLTEF